LRNCFITLGAFGDCITTLPLVLRDYQVGNHPTFFIANDYKSLLDGVTYCDRMVWDGHYSQSQQAFDHACSLKQFDNVYLCQCYGTSIERHTESYAKESWRLVGAVDLWNKLPLVFDNRSKIREQELVDKVGPRSKPMVLVATSGKSSPFPYINSLMEILKPLKEKFDFVWLDEMVADRIYDLIGLMERALCLIATDSAPLHLSYAVPSLPVIALVTHSPDLWHGSPLRSNHIGYIRYNDFERRKSEIADILNKLSGPIPYFSESTPKNLSDPTLIHVMSEYNRFDRGAIKRYDVAKETWRRAYEEGRWSTFYVHQDTLKRNANSVGEQKPVPFVRDLLLEAVRIAGPNDIIVFTNDDTCLIPGLTKTLLNIVPDRGALYGSRREIRSFSKPLSMESIMSGYKHVGADVFAFTQQWWEKWNHEFPDFLLSFEAWDLVLKKLILETGGVEVENTCYHEIHESFWHTAANRECAGNLYNRELTRQWLAKHGIGWAEAFK